MTRGQRDGELVRADFIARLVPVVITLLGLNNADSDAVKAAVDGFFGRDRLYGLAKAYKLLSEHEDVMSCPKTQSTIPCYLHTHVSNERLRRAIEEYVLAASMLFKRGSDIVALLVALTEDRVNQTSLTSSFDLFTNLNPLGAETAGKFEDIASFTMSADDLKQCFLPERWPTEKMPRIPIVDRVLQSHGQHLAHLLPDWKAIMMTSGWDNILNRMASKYIGTVKTMVQETFAKTCKAYLVTVLTRLHAFDFPTTDELEGFQNAILDSLMRRPRPLAIHNDEFELITRIRHDCLGCPTTDPLWNPPSSVRPLDKQMLKAHLFMSLALSKKTSLPEVKRGRHFVYLDEKIMDKLLSTAYKGERKFFNDLFSDTSIAGVFGLTPKEFGNKRRLVRRSVRRRYRKRYGRDQSVHVRNAKRAELRKKWRRLGRGTMPEDAMVQSVETDGVGLRIVINRPDKKIIESVSRVFDDNDISIIRQVVERSKACSSSSQPLTLDDVVKAMKAEQRKRLREKTKEACGGCKKKKAASTSSASSSVPDHPRSLSEEWYGVDNDGAMRPAFGACDTGRAKLMTTAVTHDALKKPESVVFTRQKYYAAMGYWKHRRWERNRMERNVAARRAIEALSRAASLHSPSDKLTRWTAMMTCEATHWETLFEEFVEDKQRAIWKMRLLRRKRSCMDREMARIVQTATRGKKERDFVIGIGNADFSSSSRGELSAPTSGLTTAFRRMKARRDVLMAKGGGRTVLLSVWEHRTTISCCACGQPTAAATVRRDNRECPSRRLRVCTSCDKTHGKLRDRDVQAARNILWLTIYMFYGVERPWYMTRAWSDGVVEGQLQN